ncbi:HK97-gp10 family putative phage morphogenesis protein [Thermaerobacillus caldiproteolyticus]|uniref:HK97-gp10 family putative phage morphogenesis protein n=1 Tax=Thermaerobacillus caldiproteolyticus TaxID=247480 RepID=UPI0018F258FC|nr:HK97-gp10 family putative phage morphogenesis protein [Anoxybacillus caldiproteolyticus]
MARFDFDGLDEIIEHFNEMDPKLEEADAKALQAGGEVIAKYQRELVNRSDKDQPHIQDNITVSKPSVDKDGEKYVSVGPNKKVAWRAKFLEYGTSKMPAYPFIEKGATEAEDEVTDVMEEIYFEAMER